MEIVYAAVMLGAMGLIFGGLLWAASRAFAVPENARKSQIREALPGANCGGCGCAGCDAFAEAVDAGKAKVSGCPVGGQPVAEKLAEIMGVKADVMQRKVATVMCRGSFARVNARFDYEGIGDCRAASIVAEGNKACRYSCLGMGTCERACPFGAIRINEQKLAVVDTDKCTGCGTCVASCPRFVLTMLPVSHPVHRTCSAMERGKTVSLVCTAGCIGCGKCERQCKFGAIEMKNNLPQIDIGKCVGCMRCADGCPTGALASNEALRRRAVINIQKCTNCGECKKTCQFEAIGAEVGGKHTVIDWNCVGCGACVNVCPEKCIQMVSSQKLNSD